MTQGWPPQICTGVTKLERDMGEGHRVIKFIEMFCRITKDSIGGVAGEHIALRPWQRSLTREVFARRSDGKYKHRQCYIGMPRKQGKSALISGWGLFSLVMGPTGGEVYCVASTKDQAKIVFGNIKRMVQLDPDLSREIDIYAEALHCRSNDSVLKVVAADAPALEGMNPTFTMMDEVHVYPDRAIWDVFALASGARVEPMMVGITTAGKRTDASGDLSLAYNLYEYGEKISKGELDDETFYCAWWQPKQKDVASDNKVAWKQANPGLGTLIDPEEMESSYKKTQEAEFRTKRMNMWVDQSTAWLPEDAWEKCEDKSHTASEAPEYVLALDGSYSNDSTAVVAVSIGVKPHVVLLGLWERDDDRSWRVPISDVEKTVLDFCKANTVKEVSCDPYRWQRTMAYWLEEGLPVVEYPQSPNRMVPATQRIYEAVVNQTVSQSGDPHLTRHMRNAAVKVDSRGSRIVKSQFTRKIDAAVATVMAFDRASWWTQQPKPKSRKAYGFAGYG